MELLPAQIAHKQFVTVLRGYEPADVRDFLADTAAEVERLRAALGTAHADLGTAQEELGRARGELEGSRTELERVRAELERVRGGLERIRAGLERAPAEGAARRSSVSDGGSSAEGEGSPPGMPSAGPERPLAGGAAIDGKSQPAGQGGALAEDVSRILQSAHEAAGHVTARAEARAAYLVELASERLRRAAQAEQCARDASESAAALRPPAGVDSYAAAYSAYLLDATRAY